MIKISALSTDMHIRLFGDQREIGFGCVFSSECIFSMLVGAVKAIPISSLIGLQHETDSSYRLHNDSTPSHCLLSAVDFHKATKKNV
jgi:hypothetical protein